MICYFIIKIHYIIPWYTIISILTNFFNIQMIYIHSITMGINTLYDNSMNDNVRITTISSLKPEQLKIVNINEKDAISRLYGK
ncbi:unnamed protein product [Schistosoma intercalatum]|nr:unnamed protein product [Schistosoma intercalatum]